MSAVESPINMETFENVVHNWFAESTGLETVWREQSAPQPEYPFGSLLITSGPIPSAPSWEVRNDTDLNRPAGQEVQTNVCVPCQFVVSCQAYVGGDDKINPGGNARYFVNKAQSALSLPSKKAEFRAAGVSIIRAGAVLNISALIEDAFVSRAGMDVEFGAVLNLSEYTTYIQKTHVESTALGIDRIFGDV